MEQEVRKATDVLLELESKIEVLLQIIRSQDLNIKLLSNKLSIMMEKLENQEVTNLPSKIVVEAVDNFPAASTEPKSIPVSSDFNLPIESAPQGFRRTSRPETFSGDDVYLKSSDNSTIKLPMQLPKLPTDRQANKSVEAEVIVPNTSFEERKPPQNKKTKSNSDGTTVIPIVQRVVDKNGKSIFLADVEIFNSDKESVHKTRTNGTGKWMASLPIGTYKVIIKKRESVSKEKLEAVQDIQVDGSQSPLELHTMIIKS